MYSRTCSYRSAWDTGSARVEALTCRAGSTPTEGASEPSGWLAAFNWTSSQIPEGSERSAASPSAVVAVQRRGQGGGEGGAAAGIRLFDGCCIIVLLRLFFYGCFLVIGLTEEHGSELRVLLSCGAVQSASGSAPTP